MCEVGTLKELNVKPGDVVECIYGSFDARTGDVLTINNNCDIHNYKYGKTNASTFRIISRASYAPKLWRDMTPEEKGAFLLAHHEGKVIEWSYGLPWETAHSSDEYEYGPLWADGSYYRVRPEPKIETIAEEVELNGKSIILEYTTIGGVLDKSSIKAQE